MKLGSLFSGAGLSDLGWMMAGFDIRWQVEIDDYCRKVLDLRFPEAKKYDDIKKIKGSEIESVDIVVGGFPCQPFSVAGKQRGTADDRNLWPGMLRVVKEVRPAWVVGENVSGIIPIYLDTILADLEAAGYAARTFVFPAHALGANHRRERIWIVGHASSDGWDYADKNSRGFKQRSHEPERAQGENETSKSSRPNSSSRRNSNVADTNGNGLQGSVKRLQETKESFAVKTLLCTPRLFFKNDIPKSRVCGTNDGVSSKMDRLKALGNGQVVACTAFIGQQIMEIERLNAS